MKKLLLSTLIITLFACSGPLDKKLSKEDLPEAKTKIAEMDYSNGKKRYINDQLTQTIGFIELGKSMQPDADLDKVPTFKSEIEDYASEYDSIKQVKIKAADENKKLENFIVLKDAKTYSIDEYKGNLGLTIDFNNEFEKKVLYVVLNYKYIDKYDSKFFDEKVKLTDQVANNFDKEIELATSEEYNDVAEFMYKKVPVQASKELREKLGEDEANRKVEKDFLMAGLQIKPLLVVFEDKSEIAYQDSEWEYLD